MIENSLLHTLVDDLTAFAKNLDIVLSNERDLQVRLAMYLDKLSYYDKVEVEYAIPLETLGFHRLPRKKKGETEEGKEPFEGCAHNFPWPNDIYADIVVEKNGEYAIVELKYGTRTIAEDTYNCSRFGTKNSVPIIITQGAQDITMYKYCKDIRRIEFLSEKFSRLVGGVALIITNDHLYWEEPKIKPVGYENFSLHEGNDLKEVKWRPEFSKKVIKSHPDFSLAKSYHCHWENTAWDNTGKDEAKMKKGYIFRYLLTVVEKIKI